MKKIKKGFTLVETVIAVGMATMMIVLVVKMAGIISGDVARGTVDLQNLQDARLVLNYLRRDFSCAAPYIAPPDFNNPDDIVNRDRVRANPIVKGSSVPEGSSVPIFVNENLQEIYFVKKSLDSTGAFKNETINYEFISGSNTLVRRCAENGQTHTKEFDGIADIKFDLCYHPIKQEVPMLLVKMVVLSDEGNKTKSQPLPITTTICSSVVSKDIINLDWNSVGQ